MSLTTFIVIAIFWYAAQRSDSNKRAAQAQHDQWLADYTKRYHG